MCSIYHKFVPWISILNVIIVMDTNLQLMLVWCCPFPQLAHTRLKLALKRIRKSKPTCYKAHMELLFSHYRLSNQMPMVAKEDLVLVFLGPFHAESLQHCIEFVTH